MSMNARETQLRRIRAIVPFVFVVLSYAGVRLIFSDHMAHGDERHWVGRSLNFYRALVNHEFAYTYQKEHPGVMTMWAGTLGYIFRFPGILSNMTGNNPDAQTSILKMWDWGMHPPEVLVALRAAKVLLQTAFFALTLVLLRPVIGSLATLVFGGMLAFSTTLIGWDSWLHIDGLAAITAIAAISALAFAGERTNFSLAPDNKVRLAWFFAGVLCATSWLNRITSLLLVGVIFLVLLVQIVAQHKSAQESIINRRQTWVSAFQYGAFGVAGAIVGTLALFPALWVDPVGVAKRIVMLPISGARGDGPANFFPDSIVDPGGSYYLEELLIRTTPFEWIGLVSIVLFGYVAWKRKLIPGGALRISFVALVFAAVFVAAITLSPKKAPQYLGTIYPSVTLIASIGLAVLAGVLTKILPRVGKIAGYSVLGAALCYSAIASWQSMPYKNVYNNPIGLDLLDMTPRISIRPGYPQIAEYLVDNDYHSVDIGHSTGGFGTIFGYHIPPSNEVTMTRWREMTSPKDWYAQDFHIVGANYPVDEPHYRYGVEPIETFVVQGHVYWELYVGETFPPHWRGLPATACTTTFGEQVTLYQVDAWSVSTDLYFVSENGSAVTVEVSMDTAAGSEVVQRVDLVPAASGVLMKASFDPAPRTDLAKALPTELTIQVFDSETGEPLTPVVADDELAEMPLAVDTHCFDKVPEESPGT